MIEKDQMQVRKVRVTATDTQEFIAALLAADEAAEGDSNDAEIEALQEVRDQAMSLLGIAQTQDGEGYELRHPND